MHNICLSWFVYGICNDFVDFSMYNIFRLLGIGYFISAPTIYVVLLRFELWCARRDAVPVRLVSVPVGQCP